MKFHLGLALALALSLTGATAIAAGAALAAAETTGPAAERQVWLRPSISVEGRDITLGDLFEGAGAAGRRIFAAAPSPGAQINFRLAEVMAAADAAHLVWLPARNLRFVSVTRLGKVVPRRQILDRLSEAVARQAGGPHMPVLLSDPNFSLAVAMDQPPTFRIEDLDYDPRSQRFSAVLAAPAADPRAPRVRVEGRLHQVAEVPVLKVRYSAGEVIRKDDIDWIEVGNDRVTTDIITDAGALIGQAARRPLAAGALIRGNDIQRPTLVAKGALVTMSLSTPHMSLSTTGRAIEAGGMGEAIPVMNTQSNKTVLATVVGPNQVAVTASRPLAAAR